MRLLSIRSIFTKEQFHFYKNVTKSESKKKIYAISTVSIILIAILTAVVLTLNYQAPLESDLNAESSSEEVLQPTSPPEMFEDTYEPDNSFYEYNEISITSDLQSQNRSFSSENDEDWIRFYVEKGKKYVIYTEGNVDTEVFAYFYNPTNIELQDDNSGEANNFYLEFYVTELTEFNRFSLKIISHNLNQSSTSSYSLNFFSMPSERTQNMISAITEIQDIVISANSSCSWNEKPSLTGYSIPNKLLIWDYSDNSEAVAYEKLESYSDRIPNSIDEPMTIFVIVNTIWEYQFSYTDGAKAYLGENHIIVINWPEKEIVGCQVIIGDEPPSSYTKIIGNSPRDQYGDIWDPTCNWIETLMVN